MKHFFKVLIVLFAIGTLASCLSSAPMMLGSPSAKRNYSAPSLVKTGLDDKFYITRIQQLKEIPKGSSVAVLAAGSAAFGLFVEADLEQAQLKVRQIDLYTLLTPIQKNLTDPSKDFVFINSLVDNIAQQTKESAPALAEKLLNEDKLTVENQLMTNYKAVHSSLKELIKLHNVDYLVFIGPVFQERSYAMKIYDTGSFDLVYSALFVGGNKEWRDQIGQPVKDATRSYSYNTDKEPDSFWEMAFSAWAIKNLKIGGAAAGAGPK